MKKKKKIKIMLISIIKIMKKIHMPLHHLNKIIIKIIIKKKVVIKNLQLMKKKISNFKENYTEILNYNLKIEYMNNV
jgi:hypothetical protein